jgi:hypothetical protein
LFGDGRERFYHHGGFIERPPGIDQAALEPVASWPLHLLVDRIVSELNERRGSN